MRLAPMLILAVLAAADTPCARADQLQPSTLQLGGRDEASIEYKYRLVKVVRAAFKKVNPIVETVTILERRSLGPMGPHVVIAEGVREDEDFHGKFEDELFGVFLLNADQESIEQVLEIMPTPRWRDYELKIKSLTARRVVVIGYGGSYNDGPIRRVYNIGR